MSDSRAMPLEANLKQLRLPTMSAEFTKLAREASTDSRAGSEERHYAHTDSQYIHVLQLLAMHAHVRVRRAIGQCRSQGLPDTELFRSQPARLPVRYGASSQAAHTNIQTIPLQVQVSRVDLSRFNQLLSIGDTAHA